MRKVHRTPIHIQIGRAILEKISGTEMPSSFSDLFREEAHRHNIFHSKDADQYNAQWQMTHRYLKRKLAERKRNASHRHAGHTHTNHRPKSIGEEILAMQDPEWVPFIERSHPEYPDY